LGFWKSIRTCVISPGFDIHQKEADRKKGGIFDFGFVTLETKEIIMFNSLNEEFGFCENGR
jgi:hypothetical protein